MKVVRSLDGFGEARAALPGRVGLVATMGALHDGHVALLAEARRSCDHVVASIFVNPLQFAPGEDFNRYPRDEAGDLEQLCRAGCDLAWLPDVEALYPPGDATTIELKGPALGWEGAIRPGHFRGVATVVTKLFGRVQPQQAFFGEKDWQQLQVVRRLVADLALPVEIRPVATVREADGLAMSSRNRFLSGSERERAATFPLVLRRVVDALATAEADVMLEKTRCSVTLATTELEKAGLSVDYLAVVEAETLTVPRRPAGPLRLVGAVRLGAVRLLDNFPITLCMR